MTYVYIASYVIIGLYFTLFSRMKHVFDDVIGRSILFIGWPIVFFSIYPGIFIGRIDRYLKRNKEKK